MKLILTVFFSLMISLQIYSQNLTQSYSGKFGFYDSGEGLNNGLILGIDGITEFNNYNFFLSGAIDLYYKKTIDIFNDPKPNVTDQQIILLPLHVNFGYKLFQVPDADTRLYAGVGGGYYFFFYDVNYQEDGIIPLTKSESPRGGNIFLSLFARVLIGKIFLEPRYYLATSEENNLGDFSYKIDPSGFAITLGFQY